MRRSLSGIVALICCAALSAWGKTPVSVLGAYVEGHDSEYTEGLSRDLGQALAEDTSMLVFDLRKKNAGALDSAHASGKLGQASLLAPMNGNQVQWWIA
jgi:hypothetical protein